MKCFNVTGVCVEEKHYMVDISGKIEKIMALIDKGHYFTINRARQYGKTTTLFMLRKALPADYTCINMSFEDGGEAMFENEEAFCREFLRKVSESIANTDKDFAMTWCDKAVNSFGSLGRHLHKLCKNRKIVLLIDEVDRTSNNRVFIHFLGMLRSKYLSRDWGDSFTFHSVILAGVYDIKNIKLKLINEGSYPQQGDVGRIYNSPWNIAASFDVDMSFNPVEIAGMLSQYEADHHTSMDIASVSEEIYNYTSGYPFMVSRLCKCIDEELGKDWTKKGVQDAVVVVIQEKNVLFDDLAKNLENNKELYDFLYDLLIIGKRKTFVIDVPVIDLASTYGYIKRNAENGRIGQSGYAVISNKIFEMRMSNYFISKDENASHMENAVCEGLYQDIVNGGVFNMELCLQKFAEHYRELFAGQDAPFLERHGRLLFLSYLRPLINGRGFYHIESQFTDTRRMDVAIDFGSDRFIVELKLWKGEAANEKAYDQLLGYMDSRNAAAGYLLIFDFRKEKNKESRERWIETAGKRIFEVIV